MPEPDEEDEVRREVDRALGGMLAELASFCAAHSIAPVQLERLFRKHSVKAAREQLKREGVPSTTVRLADATGFPRFFVEEALARIEEQDRAESVREPAINDDELLERLGLVIHTWNTDPRFTAFAGVPLDLNVSAKEHIDRPTFFELVTEVAPGVDMHHALQTLRQMGVITADDDGRTVKLVSDAISYRNQRARSIRRFGRVASGLMRTLRQNRVPEGGCALYERTLMTDQPLADQGFEEFQERVLESGDRWLTTVDAEQRSYIARQGQPGRQWGLCAFLFEVPDSYRDGEDGHQVIDVLDPRGSTIVR